jgi:hypothetical protein
MLLQHCLVRQTLGNSRSGTCWAMLLGVASAVLSLLRIGGMLCKESTTGWQGGSAWMLHHHLSIRILLRNSRGTVSVGGCGLQFKYTTGVFFWERNTALAECQDTLGTNPWLHLESRALHC